MTDDLDAMAAEIIAMHNERYHPGQNCPEEDEAVACAARTGKSAVLRGTDHGIERLGSGSSDTSVETPGFSRGEETEAWAGRRASNVFTRWVASL